MESWQERVLDEQNELRKRIFKLSAFQQSSEHTLLDSRDQEILSDQINAMNRYFECLKQRIDKF